MQNFFLRFRPTAFTADGCYARKVVTACLASVTVGKGMWLIQMELKDDRHPFAFQPLVIDCSRGGAGRCPRNQSMSA